MMSRCVKTQAVYTSTYTFAVSPLWFGLLFFLASTNNLLASEDEHKGASPNKVESLSGYRLKYSVRTTAKKSTIWRLWADVENWKKFDTLLEYSRLDDEQAFELGATGVIKAKGNRKARFTITELIRGVSFTEKLFVPLYQSIDLKRYFEQSDEGETIFVHEVVFKGRLRFLIYAAAAKTFKKELPLVMGRLKEVAESEEALLR